MKYRFGVLEFAGFEYIVKLQLIIGYITIIVLTACPTPQAINVKYVMTARTWFDAKNSPPPETGN